MSDLSPIQSLIDRLSSDIDAFKANQARDLQAISDKDDEIASLKTQLAEALNPPTDPDIPVIADLANQLQEISIKLAG